MKRTQSRSERIYDVIVSNTKKLDFKETPPVFDPLYIQNLSLATGISANNISMELNRLFADGLLLRVRGRPVVYFPLAVLEKKLHLPFPSNEFSSMDDFLSFLGLRGNHAPSGKTDGFSHTKQRLKADAASDFDTLIGASQSLKPYIESAKASVLYPPHGLHTLITGQTGVGKSHFVACMFDFARKSGKFLEDAPMITFNCANYSDNPQLLLSQLFGYSKGAFTGADKDHPGLVELADTGLLFLDEIHRLNAEGQEKLFLLMDKGIFRRMGETKQERHADVLIIGATTETPQSSMLETFLRRIPVHLTIPSLSERSILERLQLVLFFFWKESQNIKKQIIIEREIISTFVHYVCPANIGQLESDIRLTCANAYYKYLLNEETSLKIEFVDLNKHIALSLFTSGGNSKIVDALLKNVTIAINGYETLPHIFGQFLNLPGGQMYPS